MKNMHILIKIFFLNKHKIMRDKNKQWNCKHEKYIFKHVLKIINLI